MVAVVAMAAAVVAATILGETEYAVVSDTMRAVGQPGDGAEGNGERLLVGFFRSYLILAPNETILTLIFILY